MPTAPRPARSLLALALIANVVAASAPTAALGGQLARDTAPTVAPATRPPTPADVRSVWVGLRPLVRPAAVQDGGETKAISREHTMWLGRRG